MDESLVALPYQRPNNKSLWRGSDQMPTVLAVLPSNTLLATGFTSHGFPDTRDFTTTVNLDANPPDLWNRPKPLCLCSRITRQAPIG